MSINRLQRPRLVIVGSGMAGMRTVGEADKIYHTAETLFPSARSTPVGIRQSNHSLDSSRLCDVSRTALLSHSPLTQILNADARLCSVT
jgi:hypothetical protein